MTQRYASTPKISSGFQYGTSTVHNSIRRAVQEGRISVQTYTLKEGERLDILAGRFYKNSRLWWLIAASSGIGWGLQVPPGTQILIPVDLTQLAGIA